MLVVESSCDIEMKPDEGLGSLAAKGYMFAHDINGFFASSNSCGHRGLLLPHSRAVGRQ